MLRQTAAAAVEKALDGLALRQRAVASNLANAETPGFRPRMVAFEEALRAAIRTERAVRAPAGSRTTVDAVTPRTVQQAVPLNATTTVNPETELTELARTSLHFEALSRVSGKQLRMLRTAITGGSPQ